jgi:hypothetical protein
VIRERAPADLLRQENDDLLRQENDLDRTDQTTPARMSAFSLPARVLPDGEI